MEDDVEFDYREAFGLDDDHPVPEGYAEPEEENIDEPPVDELEDAPVDDYEDDSTEDTAPSDAARIAALEEQMRQRDMAELRARNTALEETLRNLQARMEKDAEANKPKEPEFDWNALVAGTELTDEEKQAYNPQTIAVIQKLAAQAAAERLRQYDEARIAALQAQVGRVQEVEQRVQFSQQQIAQQREMETANAVVAANPWVTQAKSTPEYQAFLADRLPGTVYTRAQLIEAAIKGGNAQQVNEILATYPGANRQTRRQNVAPGGRPNTQVAPPTDERRGRPRRFQYSEYVKANRELAEGTISMEDYNRIEARYSQALASGDIEF